MIYLFTNILFPFNTRFVQIFSSKEDKEMTLKKIKAIKTSNYQSISSDCSPLFLDDEDIRRNLDNLSQFLNISNASNEMENFSDSTITEAGKMFIYLNSCPNDVQREKNYWDIFYNLNILQKPIESILLTLLKVINYSSEDGRNIAKTVLKKLLNEMKYGSNEFERLTEPEKYNFKILKGLSGTICQMKFLKLYIQYDSNRKI